MQGELAKRQSGGKAETAYAFFLFNDALLYAKDSFAPVGRGRYTLHRKFDIGDRVEDRAAPGEASNRISVPASCEGGRLIEVSGHGPRWAWQISVHFGARVFEPLLHAHVGCGACAIDQDPSGSRRGPTDVGGWW